MKKTVKAIAATTIVNGPIFRLTDYRNKDRYGNGHFNADGTVSLISDPVAQRESDKEWRS